MNQTRILLLEGVVQTMAGPVLNPGFVLVEDGKIAAVGLMADLFQIPEGTTIIDCQGQTILPGLIDAHCHLGILEEIYREDGDDLNEISDPVTPQLRALDAVNPEDVAFENARRGGVTSVCIGPGSTNVIGGEMMVMKTAPACFPDAQLLLAPAGLKIAFGENPKRAFGRQQKAPLTRMAIAAQLRQAFTAAQDYIHPQSTAPARDLKLEALARALQRKTIVRAHAHRADDIMTAVRIAEEFSLAVCIEHGTDAHKLAPELARRGIPVILGPLLGGGPSRK